MGPALDALQGITRLADRAPAALVVVGVLGAIALVASVLFNAIPLVGWLIGIPVFVLALGAAYAVADHGLDGGTTSMAPAGDVVRERWLSLLGAYALVFGLWIAALLVSFAVAFVLVIAGAFADAAVDGPAAAGVVFIAGGGATAIVYFLCAMLAQFLVPAVAVEHTGAIEGLKVAVDVVTSAPVSVAGFTLLRVILEYGLVIAALLLAVLVGTVGGLTGDLVGLNPAELDAGLVAGTLDLVGFLVILAVLFGGIAVSQALRVTYTTAFFRRSRKPSNA